MSEPERDTAFVMDSGSLLAFLRGEGGGALVQRVLKQCFECETRVEITANDLLEAYSLVAAESSTSLEELASLVDQLPLTVEPITRDAAIASAQILAEHPELTPSQASSLLLARERGATLITAERKLASLSPSLYVGPKQDEGDLARTHEFQENSPDLRR